jgi:hypothetical protein
MSKEQLAMVLLRTISISHGSQIPFTFSLLPVTKATPPASNKPRPAYPLATRADNSGLNA